MSIPIDRISEFLDRCTHDLNELSIDHYESISEIRRLLMETQRTCLARVLPTSSEQELQKALKDPALEKPVQALNQAARGAFARLVLCAEIQAAPGTRTLTCRGSLPRSAIMEFCGLCQAIVHIKEVQDHLKDGRPLFGPPNQQQQHTPQERLETIQRHYLEALGYDSEFGKAEIKRIFFTDGPHSEFAQDRELVHAFMDLLQTMNQVVAEASMHAQQAALGQFSDIHQGGVTRVVSVSASEKIVGGDDTVESVSGPVMGETIHAEEQQRAELEMAKRAATMQQEILGQLLAMRGEERTENLERAKRCVDEFIQKAMSVPPGPERIAIMQGMDPETQRYMAMHKIWESVVQSNGGKEPIINFRK